MPLIGASTEQQPRRAAASSTRPFAASRRERASVMSSSREPAVSRSAVWTGDTRDKRPEASPNRQGRRGSHARRPTRGVGDRCQDRTGGRDLAVGPAPSHCPGRPDAAAGCPRSPTPDCRRLKRRCGEPSSCTRASP
jgi:hypothetical protein